jgi:hypothetical protein
MADPKKNRPQSGSTPRRNPRQPGDNQEEVEQVEEETALPRDARQADRYQDAEDAEFAEFAEEQDDPAQAQSAGTPEEAQASRAQEYQHQGRQARGGAVLKNPITRDMVDKQRAAPKANLRGGLSGGGASKSRNDKVVIAFFSVALALVLIALILPDQWVRPGAEEEVPAEFDPEDVGWDKLDTMHERMVETEKREMRRRQQALREARANMPETQSTAILEEDYSELLEPLPGEEAATPGDTLPTGSALGGNTLSPGNSSRNTPQTGASREMPGLPVTTGSHKQNLPPLDAGTTVPSNGRPGNSSTIGTNGLGTNAATPGGDLDPEKQQKLRELEAEIELKLQSQENSAN